MKKLFKGGLLYMYLLLLLLLLNSCSSQCSRTKRYWGKHRCVEAIKPQHNITNKQYEKV